MNRMDLQVIDGVLFSCVQWCVKATSDWYKDAKTDLRVGFGNGARLDPPRLPGVENEPKYAIERPPLYIPLYGRSHERYR